MERAVIASPQVGELQHCSLCTGVHKGVGNVSRNGCYKRAYFAPESWSANSSQATLDTLIYWPTPPSR